MAPFLFLVRKGERRESCLGWCPHGSKQPLPNLVSVLTGVSAPAFPLGPRPLCTGRDRAAAECATGFHAQKLRSIMAANCQVPFFHMHAFSSCWQRTSSAQQAATVAAVENHFRLTGHRASFFVQEERENPSIVLRPRCGCSRSLTFQSTPCSLLQILSRRNCPLAGNNCRKD